ncbi:NAD(P)/FAD-dependent oxidoreductase [Kibdelosporangium persicum]|uniref:Pyridine nucleotide-disulfide oxidoreductase n=1 Tax=Kibdelosporangium persicum TaxID=2698649 RepID=A0ABX2F5I2_9PSEU|nr:FAD-dependent monooxygenase [Kibdelosporangium persicum]NRN66604.1 Pyridine nucleotide-disulfide oxidoreductase [Kibdelosporangium persicum]
MASTHGVVLGGGLAGMLTASVLARHVDAVTVVDRDHLPDGPRPRTGVPQARHAHLLQSGGARMIDRILPGTIDRLIGSGARRIGLPSDVVAFSAHGWMRRFPEVQFMICCSRDLLDWVVRDQALANDRISVRENTEVVGLHGDAAKVTAAIVEDRTTRRTTRLDADIVVDTTGRGSKAGKWLRALGLPDIREETVDPGVTYATRVFQAPAGTVDRFPLVNIQASPTDPHPAQTASLLPIEQGRWLVTISGMRGAGPTADEEGFVEFARSVRHPLVGDLIAQARPLSPIHLSHSTKNRRTYFERLSSWPDGIVVLGDAVATFNPVYGHGMSIAAHSAAALHRQLWQRGLAPGMSRQVQRAIGRVVNTAWTMAINQDMRYPGVAGKQQSLARRLPQRFFDRLSRTATSEPQVTAALLNAFTLSEPMTTLMNPAVILSTLRGPRRPPLTEPTLTAAELASCHD